MDDDNTDHDYETLSTSDHEVIAALVELKTRGNGAALVLLREKFTPEHLEANEAWQAARSTAKRRQEEHDRDAADRQRYENSLTGASRIAAILRRSAGIV